MGMSFGEQMVSFHSGMGSTLVLVLVVSNSDVEGVEPVFSFAEVFTACLDYLFVLEKLAV